MDGRIPFISFPVVELRVEVFWKTIDASPVLLVFRLECGRANPFIERKISKHKTICMCFL